MKNHNPSLNEQISPDDMASLRHFRGKKIKMIASTTYDKGIIIEFEDGTFLALTGDINIRTKLKENILKKSQLKPLIKQVLKEMYSKLRLPTKKEEENFLNVIKTEFMVGYKGLLNRPEYKDIDFTQTLKDAKNRGEIDINDKGVILSLDTEDRGGYTDLPQLAGHVDNIRIPHSQNEGLDK